MYADMAPRYQSAKLNRINTILWGDLKQEIHKRDRSSPASTLTITCTVYSRVFFCLHQHCCDSHTQRGNPVSMRKELGLYTFYFHPFTETDYFLFLVVSFKVLSC